MRQWTARFVCPVLSLLILSVPATAQEYWNYKTAHTAYDRGDFALAADMYKRLATDGHMRAQNDLAFMYEVGQGVMPNPGKAAMWYHKAAEQGHGPSQYRIAVLYLAGRGIAKDKIEAHKWFSLAGVLLRDNGRRTLARNQRAALETKLTGVQGATARKRACDWWLPYRKSGAAAHPAMASCSAE